MPAIPLIGAAAGALGTVGSLVGQQKQGELSAKEAKRARRAKAAAAALARADFLESQKSMLGETASALPELTAAQDAIRRGTTREQEDAAKRTNLALSQQGVRGARGAQLAAREQGLMTENLMDQINQMAMNEAQQRRGIRTGFYGQKGQLSQPISYGG